jgi:hypothetical protein
MIIPDRGFGYNLKLNIFHFCGSVFYCSTVLRFVLSEDLRHSPMRFFLFLLLKSINKGILLVFVVSVELYVIKIKAKKPIL